MDSPAHKIHYVPLPVRWSAKTLLALLGWKVVGDPNRVPKAVIIGAYHTTNWDGILAIPCAYALDMNFRWMGKDSLFRFPLGIVARMAGGIPVDRSSPHNVVEQMIEILNRSEHLFLIIAPEATRKKAPYWRSGFYYIALGAQVPIIFGFIDYAKKEAGVDTIFYPSGDVEADMEVIRAFYQKVTPKRPDRQNPIRLQPKD